MRPVRSVHDLIGDYLEVLACGARRGHSAEGSSPVGHRPPDLDIRLRAYHHFIVRQSHHLLRDPALLFPLAIAQPEDSPARADALALEAAGRDPAKPWLCRLHPPPTDPNPALIRTLEGHTDGVNSVALSGDGPPPSRGAGDKTVRVWDLSTGRCSAVLEGHTRWVTSVALSGDGRTAVSGSWDGTLRVWDLSTGRCSAVLEGHTHWVSSVALSGDGRTAVSGSNDQTVRVWDLSTGRCSAVLEGHTNWVNSVALSGDGRTALSGSEDKTVRVWDLSHRPLLRRPRRPHRLGEFGGVERRRAHRPLGERGQNGSGLGPVHRPLRRRPPRPHRLGEFGGVERRRAHRRLGEQ